MAYFVGDAISEGFSTGTAGETIVLDVGYGPGGASFTPAFSEIGSGRYLVTFTPSVAGEYYAAWHGATSNVRFEGNWDVDASPTGPAVGVSSSTGTSLATLVRDVAYAVHDLREATASAATGSTSTFRAAEDLYEDDRFFRGAEAYFASGTAGNLGLVRRISGSDLATQTLTFATPLAVGAQPGDLIQVTNLMSQGWRRIDYKREINRAIRDADPANRVPYTAAGATTYVTAGFVAIPAAFTHLNLVEWQDADGNWTPIRYAQNAGMGWFVNWTDLSVGLRKDVADAANLRPLRFTGLARATDLVADSDVTSTDAEYITNYAAGSLIFGRRRAQEQAFAQYLLNRADSVRAKMVHPMPANTIRVR